MTPTTPLPTLLRQYVADTIGKTELLAPIEDLLDAARHAAIFREPFTPPQDYTLALAIFTIDRLGTSTQIERAMYAWLLEVEEAG